MLCTRPLHGINYRRSGRLPKILYLFIKYCVKFRMEEEENATQLWLKTVGKNAREIVIEDDVPSVSVLDLMLVVSFTVVCVPTSCLMIVSFFGCLYIVILCMLWH